LQADGVKHACRSLDHARRAIARHRLARESLDDDPAERVQIQQMGEFQPIAERAAGGDNRVLQPDSGNLDTQVHAG
jgi:hypothetical protein